VSLFLLYHQFDSEEKPGKRGWSGFGKRVFLDGDRLFLFFINLHIRIIFSGAFLANAVAELGARVSLYNGWHWLPQYVQPRVPGEGFGVRI
jgi:hypothetical protein